MFQHQLQYRFQGPWQRPYELLPERSGERDARAPHTYPRGTEGEAIDDSLFLYIFMVASRA